jgi:protein-arginine kinase
LVSSLVDQFLTPELRARLRDLRTSGGYSLDDLIRSGVANPDSSVGAYAPDAESYVRFHDLLNDVVLAQHRLDALPAPASASAHLFFEPHPDLGPAVLSTRVRVARNLAGLPFPAGASLADREEVERRLVAALATLPGDLAGTYRPLPSMPEAERRELVDAHLLFKEGDRFLAAAGINGDWPAARGIFLSADKRLVAWVNEEDHLRLISMQAGGDLGAVVRRLDRAHAHLAEWLPFAHDPRLGYLASCPSNLGTGLRASVHVRADPSETEAKVLGLQVRGVHGEHSASANGVVDLSNAHRLGVTPDVAVQTLAKGVRALLR